jgi:hypothetical protein
MTQNAALAESIGESDGSGRFPPNTDIWTQCSDLTPKL